MIINNLILAKSTYILINYRTSQPIIQQGACTSLAPLPCMLELLTEVYRCRVMCLAVMCVEASFASSLTQSVVNIMKSPCHKTSHDFNN